MILDEYPKEITLKDKSTLTVRPMVAEDEGALLAFFQGLSESERLYLRDNVAGFWVPDDVVFIDEMPLTATGKVSKRQLRQRFQGYELPTI